MCKINLRKKPKLSGPAFFADGVTVFDGNSLTAGGYPDYVHRHFTDSGVNIKMFNFGVGGQQTTQMMADSSMQVDTQWVAKKNNLLVAWEIGNDIYYNKDVPAACERFKQYCLERKRIAKKNGHSLKIIVLTCTPRINVDDALIQEANAWQLANWRSYADGIIDLRTEPRLANITPEYYYDGIHYTDAGNKLVAKLVFDKIKTLV
jgi:hypothetical protein